MSVPRFLPQEQTARLNYWNEGSRAHGVFIAYRYVDIMAAVAIDEGLITSYFAPHSIFRADRSIQPGEQFEEVLDRALFRARAVLLIVGHQWSASFAAGQHVWAYREIRQAQDRGIPILPVVIARFDPSHSPTWLPVEHPVEQLAPDTLPPGIDRGLLEAERLTFGAVHPREDIAEIAAALTRIVPEMAKSEETRTT